jgi:predicted RND superfamily exporter protein
VATYLALIKRFPGIVLAVLFGITVFFLLQLPRLTMDSNPYLLSEDHPARKTILDMQKEFTGTYDAVLIAIENKNGIFNRVTLDAALDLTRASQRLILANQADADFLEAMGRKYAEREPRFQAGVTGLLKGGLEPNDYLQAEALQALGAGLDLSTEERTFLDYFPKRVNPIKELAGLAASENIVDDDGTLVVHMSLRDKETPPEVIREEVMGNSMMADGFVSRDETVTLVVVELAVKQEDAEGQLRAYDAFRHIVDDYAAKNPAFLAENNAFIAGVPIFIAEQKKLMDRDLATLLPFVIGIVTVILIAFFRRPLGVALPLMNVLMATIWTLGMMAVLHVPMDLITSVLPVFLITICGADAIHMMSEYYTQRGEGWDARTAVTRTLKIMVSPVVLTTVTTTAGFLLSTSTNISNIRSFGLFMVIGLGSAQLISLLLIPSWLNLFGHLGRTKPVTAAPAAPKEQTDRNGWLANALEGGLAVVIRHRKLAASVMGVVLVVLGYQATLIHVEDAGSSYFREDNQFRMADEFVNSHVAGTSPGWISVGKPGERSMLTVENAEFVEKLDHFLESQPNVTYTYSMAKYVKRLNYVMHEMDPAFNRLPEKTETITVVDPETGVASTETIPGDEIVSHAILMYENGGGSDLTNVLNSDYSKAVTMFTMNTTKASEYEELLKGLDVWLAANQPKDLTVVTGGSPVIWTGVLGEIMKGQITSFVLALAAVTLTLILWLRSWRHGVLTALPLACTMIAYYGIMSLLRIDLNIGTAIISFLVVGIVDYSVHYLHRIKHEMAEGAELDAALLRAVRHSGRSIVFNVLVFSLGFLSLLASDFTPIVHLGALVALALVISGFMSLFLLSVLAPWFIHGEAKEVKMSEMPAGAGV